MENIPEYFESFLSKCDDIKNTYGQVARTSYTRGFKPWFESYKNGNQEFKENLEGMSLNKLTEEETFVILAYTGSYSKWLNWDLRDSELTKCNCKKEFIKRLNNSLDKVKSFDNSTVYRMDSPFEDSEKMLTWFNSKIDCVFKIPYFLSTSKEDYKNSEIVWEIKTLPNNSLGKDISNLTNNKNELEVLFRTDSCFKIKGIDAEKKYVLLSEIEPETKFDFELTGYYSKNIK